MLHCVLASKWMIRLLALAWKISETLKTTSITFYFTSLAIIPACVSVGQPVTYTEWGTGSYCLHAHVLEGACIWLSQSVCAWCWLIGGFIFLLTSSLHLWVVPTHWRGLAPGSSPVSPRMMFSAITSAVFLFHLCWSLLFTGTYHF